MESPKYEPSGTATPQIERRRYPRYPAQVQIELQEKGKDVALRMETTDLSRGGCYIQLVSALQVGTYVNSTLWIDGSPVRVRGRVVTRHPQFGNGIMFLEFQDQGEQLLSRYLDAAARSDSESKLFGVEKLRV